MGEVVHAARGLVADAQGVHRRERLGLAAGEEAPLDRALTSHHVPVTLHASMPPVNSL